MLKQLHRGQAFPSGGQPPSGGCVLKRDGGGFCGFRFAATFGWLCVETSSPSNSRKPCMAATFGWLCVETGCLNSCSSSASQPPSGGCVLKHDSQGLVDGVGEAATFGWLCVETLALMLKSCLFKQPPSGGCVLKQPPRRQPD